MENLLIRPLLAVLALLPATVLADDTDLFKLDVSAPARIMLVVDTSASMARPEGNNDVVQFYAGDCTGQDRYFKDGEWVSFDNASRKICVVKDILLRFLDPDLGDPESVWPNNFEVGLARYAQQGAAIVEPIDRLGSIDNPNSKRRQLIGAIRSLRASGRTPLVGSYLEVAEYLTGGQAVTRDSGATDSEVWESTNQYKGVDLGPQCGNLNNHLVFLTDGASTCEKGSNFTESELDDFNCPDGSADLVIGDIGTRVNQFVTGVAGQYDEETCSAMTYSEYEEEGTPYKTYWGCLSQVSEKLSDNKQTENGRQVDASVKTHVIAYDMGGASTDTKNGMEAWAVAGGGLYRDASTGDEVAEAFEQINGEVVMPGTFIVASGGVGVSQLNSFTHLDELYFSMFTPSSKPFWYGNLKKYFFNFSTEGELKVYTNPGKSTLAVSDGVFLPDVNSFWSNENNIPDAFGGVDGDVAHVGGAASQIEDSTDRNLVVYYGDTDYELKPDNADASGEDIDNLKARLLAEYATFFADPEGADATAIANYGSDVLSPMLAWLSGEDVNNEWGHFIQDPTSADDSTDPEDERAAGYKGVRTLYGAPLHSSPVLVNYRSRDADGNPLSEPENVVFVSTNDGKLYAVDASNGSEKGKEKLAYVPEAMLKRTSLADPSPVERMFQATKPGAGDGSLIYGMDSTWTVWRQDVNGNGNIDEDTQDFVLLYGGMRRGGRNYYILDATDVEESSSLEQLAVIKGGEGKFLNNGQSWSEPKLAIINYRGTPTAVFIIGGGYDTVYDSGRPETLPAKGAQIYIVSARTFLERDGGARHEAGEVLWWASSDSILGDETHVQIAALEYSIPSSVKTVDIDADGYLDFFYVGDMGGQIHRFDVNNSNTGAANLISNTADTVIAQLGVAGVDSVSQDMDRRFFYPPSIAKMRCPRGFCMSLAIGSGWRSNPTDVSVTEKFYFLMDYEPFTPGQNEPVITETATTEAGGSVTVVQALTKTDDAESITAASNDAGIKGYSLELGGTGYDAEKLLGAPLIVGGSAYFSTYYRPPEMPDTDTCQVGEGASAVYQFTPGDSKALQLADGLSQNVAGSIQSLITELPVADGGGEDPDNPVPPGLQGGIVSGTGSVGPAPLQLNHIRKTRWQQIE
ncbi:MAG: PilC/PilY family type IV pilus protein [Pseudomonadota bacterium]|nr:PilC/PilY family type IV pilus protein [Pseudomonadota bacterium]